ncbi:MAG: DUF1311 domain-containing protein [Rhodospirillaceae bacterium]|nr:DUF1311 domain-containing protein [Rhodospirillales bacterium]
MRKTLVFMLAFAGLFTASAARAECDSNASDAQISACLAQDLRDSDKRINAVYKALMGSMDDTAKLTLRDEQRAWLKRRDKACSLDNKETDRERWLQAIMSDQGKTVCVVRFTFGRVAELDTLLKQKGGSVPADIPPAPSTPVVAAATAAPVAALPAGLGVADEGYNLFSVRTKRTGRWYYEVWIDRGALASKGDMLLHSGYAAFGTSGVIRVTNIRRSHVGSGPISIGLAVDLDQGYVYIRQNGEWRAAPGSSGGVEVKMNRDWRAALEASAQLTEIVRAGLVKVNLGERPFDYALPDGYRPFAE